MLACLKPSSDMMVKTPKLKLKANFENEKDDGRMKGI
jgi:hypothetical protein